MESNRLRKFFVLTLFAVSVFFVNSSFVLAECPNTDCSGESSCSYHQDTRGCCEWCEGNSECIESCYPVTVGCGGPYNWMDFGICYSWGTTTSWQPSWGTNPAWSHDPRCSDHCNGACQPECNEPDMCDANTGDGCCTGSTSCWSGSSCVSCAPAAPSCNEREYNECIGNCESRRVRQNSDCSYTTLIASQHDGACDCGQAASCSDGMKNQGESGVDCGGPCAACPSGPPPGSSVPVAEQCGDNVDNDGDGWIDECPPCCPACSNGGVSCSGASCCSGLQCDATDSVCMECDGKKQKSGFGSGQGACELVCGASSECDEKAPGSVVAGGYCDGSCNYVNCAGGDVSERCCQIKSGSWAGSGWNGDSADKCCGDGDDVVRTKECAPGVCASDANDKACCDVVSDCVNGGVCYADADVKAAELYAARVSECSGKPESACLNMHPPQDNYRNKCSWAGGCAALPASKGEIRYYQASVVNSVFHNVDSDAKLEACDPGQWVDPNPFIDGYVRNLRGDVVSGVGVSVIGSSVSAVTDDNGYYRLDIAAGAYTLLARKAPYADAFNSTVIEDFSSNRSNLLLFKECVGCSSGQSDACADTAVGSDGFGYCSSRCAGCGYCPDSGPVSACDYVKGVFKKPGWFVDGDAKSCCLGDSYLRVKVDAVVDAENVVRVTRIVWYQGRPVRMIVDMFK